MLWNKAGRMRRLCPALTQTREGWRCSVNAADVRPYWGRALGYYGTALLGVYLVLTLGAFSTLRGIGYRVAYRDIVWPPGWRHLDEIRGEYYFEQGQAAFRENRISEAVLALSLAYELAPSNYDYGLALAQLGQTGRSADSNAIYARLLSTHPEQTGRTVRSWAQSLLWRADFAQLAKLSTEQLAQDPARAAPWLHSLIFSARQIGDSASLLAALELPVLNDETRAVLRLEATALSGNVAATAKDLDSSLNDATGAYLRFYQIRFLIDNGEARRAVQLLNQYGTRLSTNERVSLSLNALARLGETEKLRSEVAALLRTNATPRIYELLGAHLVRSPDRELLRRVGAQFATMPWSTTTAGLGANAALLCAAGVNRDRTLFDSLVAQFRQTTGARALALDWAEEVYLSPIGRRAPGTLLRSLPMLPLDVAYALFEVTSAEARSRRQP